MPLVSVCKKAYMLRNSKEEKIRDDKERLRIQEERLCIKKERLQSKEEALRIREECLQCFAPMFTGSEEQQVHSYAGIEDTPSPSSKILLRTAPPVLCTP
ncbi:hypothetical protein BDP27DRAFT_1434750 [Rhodocollybia butyracea]|uniref:Uncharacterized protein n=1 Tax=Rhodocollybia butyracea TaxID=206335 RepID=A0A9P5TWR5_9AGAR|nr:hypothetical protein BDP27DRAFT_1434750 [Rhodocollybia butyracea]